MYMIVHRIAEMSFIIHSCPRDTIFCSVKLLLFLVKLAEKVVSIEGELLVKMRMYCRS